MDGVRGQASPPDGDWVTEGWAASALPAGDPVRPFGYLLARQRVQYAAIMGVLDGAVDHLTPGEVTRALAASGVELPESVVAQRLRKLQEVYEAASGRPDSEIERWQELNGALWRYSATPRGRQVQRLWSQMVAEGAVQREVPVDGLARITEAVRRLAEEGGMPAAEAAVVAGGVFVEHDHLDAALVGQADVLAQLAHRFDLDGAQTGELKGLLVDYATHVVVHLERAVAVVHRHLRRLRPRFGELAAVMQEHSAAGALVERGVLAPSRGQRVEDWERLLGWFAPGTGKAARFGLHLVRAIPMMHLNLRRQHSAVGPGTLRSKALSLAVACQDPGYGRAVLRASLSDHSWVKLHTCAEGEDGGRAPSWHEGPRVAALTMLRATGQNRPRGRTAGRREREPAAREAAARRQQRRAVWEAAVAEVLSGRRPLSEEAGRAALKAVMAAVRAPRVAGVRSGRVEGLGCTVTVAAGRTGRVEGQRWSLLLPGREVAFHPPSPPPVAVLGPDAAGGQAAGEGDGAVLVVAR